ncbi:oxysterol-binding protein-related protein 1 [Trichinella spiralis]|uniref:oxysterol-binding protein-related protein 1 n=1 Tax=Trichinella spiralis TaxID=6334 RepID=UPI0001EFC52D|nr:oxysterol-binding protein-related protein 1 [Trichinella spiralis]
MEQRKCENTDGTKQNKRRQEHQSHLYANEDRLKIALSSISNGALVCLTCVASNSIVKRQTLALNRGRHEADRGRHEADRGRHEAVQEKTKFPGPQFCRSGIGILRRAKLSHSCC